MSDIEGFAPAHAMAWKQSGMGGTVTNITPSREYLDDENAFVYLSKTCEKILECGIDVWLYDELGYPSGAAGGRTTLGHPEFVAKGLVYIKKEGNGKCPVTVEREDDLIRLHSAYAVSKNGTVSVEITDEKAEFEGVDGDWTLYVFAEKKLYEGTHAQTNGYGGNNWICRDYPNLLDKNAVGAFIDNTYRRYANELSCFGQAVGVFTDEPSLMEAYLHTGETVHKYAQLAWVDGFEKKFEEMHGYSIINKLHLIFESDTDEAKTVRVNYRQTASELFAENYFAQLSQFCRKHGTKLTGHGLLEEDLVYHTVYYGDLMRCLREMDIPGADSLCAVPESYLHPDWPLFMAVKYACSVAALKGIRQTMVEFCAVDIDASNIDDAAFGKLLTTLNVMLFQGVTHINSYFALEYFGERRRGVADRLARLTYLSRMAKWNGEIALYYPINTSQAYAKPSRTARQHTPDYSVKLSHVARRLYDSGRDFTVADNVFMREAKVENGTLTNGKIAFSTIALTSVEVIPLDVLKKLIAFKENGGTVVLMGTLPTLSDRLDEHDEVKALSFEHFSVMTEDEGVEAILNAVDYGIEVSDPEGIMVGKYDLDGADMYWLVNKGEDMTVNVRVKGASGFDIYEPTAENVSSAEGESIKLELKGHSGIIIVAKK